METEEILDRMSGINLFEYPIENVRYNDEPKFPAFLTSPNESALGKYRGDNITGQGYDISASVAKLKSIAECLERICLYNPNPKTLSRKTVFGKGFVDPASFIHSLICEEEVDAIRLREYTWIKGVHILTGEDVMVPAQQIFISQFDEHPIHIEVTSNGAAIGLAEGEDDIERGLLELVERDACMYSYLSKRKVSRIVDLPGELQDLTDYLERYRLECYSFDATSDLGIPTVFTITLDRTGIGPAVSLGSSSRRNFIDAVKRSILESVQCRNYSRLMKTRYPVGSITEDDIDGLEHRLYYWYPTERIDDLDFWLNSSEVRFDEISNKTVEMQQMKDTLRKMGFNIFAIDITLPEIREVGFRCVKVVSPDLHPLYLDEKAKTTFSKHYGNIPEVALKPHPFT